MLFLNAVRVEKLTVDGSAFQTLTNLSKKTFAGDWMYIWA